MDTRLLAGLVGLAGVMLMLPAMPARAQPADEPVTLPPPALTGPVSVEDALQRRRSVRAFSSRALTLAEVSQLLWAAQGRTTADGHRTVPSAGATYPLELGLAVGRVEGLVPGLYRYDAAAHTLHRQRVGDLRAELATAVLGQAWVGTAPALLVITAVPQRTAGKYGERALRYAQIEVGHVSQSVYLQATVRGLGTTFVGAFDDARLGRMLELPPGQLPLGLMPVGALR
jgi:SagB-type dehydrogenase family enzyme